MSGKSESLTRQIHPDDDEVAFVAAMLVLRAESHATARELGRLREIADRYMTRRFEFEEPKP